MSWFYSGFFIANVIEFPCQKSTPAKCGDAVLRQFFMLSDVSVESIKIKNTLYTDGHLVVTGVDSDNVL
jgi:hypothetical protein